MGEKLKQQLKLELSSSIEDEDEKLFYEHIEAPKFVDFTRPNHYCPDDRYWFCSRVGCDMKHEEEMDSEAVYQKFVLQVMAERSPNVRLRKALSRKPTSDSKKCPLTAPPKPSKSRIPRLALVSSISRKLVLDEKSTTKDPIVKPSSTPKARVKHVAAKYMTSPRKKKGISPNQNAFRSVRNPKRTSITILKNKVVTKALVFNSPRKALKAKPSEELATPISKLCQGIKKLEINTQKKGTTQKSSREGRNVRKLLPTDVSRKKTSACKAKTRQDDLSVLHICKSKTKQKKEKKSESVVHEARAGDETSDVEIDYKPRAGLLQNSPATIKTITEERCEEEIRKSDSNTLQEENTLSSERPPTGGSSGSGAESSNPLASETASSEDMVSVPENPVVVEAPHVDEQSEAKKSSAAEVDLENQNPRVVSEFTDNDDKENASNSYNNRNLNGSNLGEHGKHGAPVKRKIKTVETQTVDKTLKENCCAGIASQGVKYRKLKPTNPKPFRLRTDERGILKEATLERRAKSHEKASIASENSQCISNGVFENKEKESKNDRSSKKEQHASQRPIKSKFKINTKEVEHKSDKGLSSGKSSRQTRTPFSEKQLARPQRETVSDTKTKGLGVIEENTATTLKPKESTKQTKLAAQGRRPATIPREPNFHSIHKPKCCTKNI